MDCFLVIKECQLQICCTLVDLPGLYVYSVSSGCVQSTDLYVYSVSRGCSGCVQSTGLYLYSVSSGCNPLYASLRILVFWLFRIKCKVGFNCKFCVTWFVGQSCIPTYNVGDFRQTHYSSYHSPFRNSSPAHYMINRYPSACPACLQMGLAVDFYTSPT